MQKRKLIEVALPLEAINRESAIEKSVPRRGHPATLHLWWARRPLAAARSVLFAQLVDDPSSHPEEFPSEESQRAERERLHDIIERLAKWENTSNDAVLSEARREILKSTGGLPPTIVDPFAGGGTIPLEAQRLGLHAEASDLNPVAVLINKALIEIPPRFAGRRPVFPGLADSQIGDWKGARGLAADVRAYGGWMRDEAKSRIGSLYPDAVLPDGTKATVIGWIWTRTVNCPNPACAIEMPLVRSWWLGKKKGRESYVTHRVVADTAHPSGQRVEFDIGHDPSGFPTKENDGTVSGRTGAVCVACGGMAPVQYLRAEGKAGRLGQQLMAIVAEGPRRRIYFPPNDLHVSAAAIAAPAESVVGSVSTNPRWSSPPAYGLTEFADLFTNRQLAALTTFSDLVLEARDRVLSDSGGDTAYADAVATYLGFLMSKLADWLSALCSWMAPVEKVRDTFSRQAFPIVWDFLEINPFSNSVGNASAHFEWIVAGIEGVPASGSASVDQADASERLKSTDAVLSTDPPYYDNIGYADLSDFFYVWLRRTLRSIHPELLSTLLVPKAEELVANPYRHDGKDGARGFFESGFRKVFAAARASAGAEFPITVWYAFKQSESDVAGEASTGWESLLEGMIDSGWTITATWPIRSERGGRMVSVGTNALASSIVLALRPRAADAPTTDRRGFIAALETELPGALRRLELGQVAPVDLPQAAIGPGMAVFSRYGAVLEPDGSKMTVRAALTRINEILDQVLNEQEGDFDATTRFAIAWYRGNGYGVGTFGDADNLARARNTSVERMDRDEILSSRAGKVQLIKPAALPWDYDVLTDSHTSAWEALHHLIKTVERDGIAPAGDFLRAALSRPDGAVDADLLKELAHLLFRVAESNGWTKDALSFNALVTSWPEILDVARTETKAVTRQDELDFDEGDE